MKREHSDSEDDFCDDDRIGSPGSGDTVSRKKRRGIIEKRRRDRINNSLAELRRLVPAAFEKQGSAKLEKAEILQYTVEHLRTLHQKGLNGYNFDPMAVATDYRSQGFRECAAEVARYLVASEGMDIQDPLRLRLMGHLQCFSSQKDTAAAASIKSYPAPAALPHLGSHSSWNGLHQHGASSYPPGVQYPAAPAVSMGLSAVSHNLHGIASTQSDILSSMTSLSESKYTSQLPPLPAASSAPTSHLTALASAALAPSAQSAHAQFPALGMAPSLSPSHSYSHSGAASALYTRPWAPTASAFCA